MYLIWLTRDRNRDLIIYMLGWAATPNAVHHIATPRYDVLACCHYMSLQPLRAADFAHYRRIYLFAWSFGVWVAEQCCRELPLFRAVALNGTPFPVSEKYGMRLRVVLRAMQMQARSGGGSQTISADAARSMPPGPYPDRSAGEKADELMYLAQCSRESSSACLRWDAAYIAEHDEIFPPERMEAYWSSVGLGVRIPGFHYPFADPRIVTSHLEPRS